MQVKVEKGNYICLKHKQIVVLVVMDDRVSLENKMLCNKCISETRSPLNQALPVQQAQEMINEKLNQKIVGQQERITKQIGILRTLQSNMIELRQQLLMNTDTITKMIESWINELSLSMKKENIELIKGLELLQQKQVEVKQNNTYIMKIESSFKKLLNVDGIQKCYQDLMNINHEQAVQSKAVQLNSQQIINKQLAPINYKFHSAVNQEESSMAIAFNNSGSIMIAGSNKDIKVFQFDKGKMTLLNLLKGEGGWIKCLLFSKINQWFVSGNREGIIQSWKQGKETQQWQGRQAEHQHTNCINCIILTKQEDQLISGSNDKVIIVWKVNYQDNLIQYHYSLDYKHSDNVNGLNLNQSETLLVSCGDDRQLILWDKVQNNRWIYKNSVTLSNHLSRICFIDENQLLVQQDGRGFLNVFQVVDQQLKEQINLKINLNLPQENSDIALFPTIYNKNKGIIIQKSHKYVYIIRKQFDGTFNVSGEPIQCETSLSYGNLSQNGEYLVIWNYNTKDFRTYKISQ